MAIYNDLILFGNIKMIKVSRMADYAILLVCKMSAVENKVYSAHELSIITSLKITTVSKILTKPSTDIRLNVLCLIRLYAE